MRHFPLAKALRRWRTFAAERQRLRRAGEAVAGRTRLGALRVGMPPSRNRAGCGRVYCAFDCYPEMILMAVADD